MWSDMLSAVFTAYVSNNITALDSSKQAQFSTRKQQAPSEWRHDAQVRASTPAVSNSPSAQDDDTQDNVIPGIQCMTIFSPQQNNSA